MRGGKEREGGEGRRENERQKVIWGEGRKRYRYPGRQNHYTDTTICIPHVPHVNGYNYCK